MCRARKCQSDATAPPARNVPLYGEVLLPYIYHVFTERVNTFGLQLLGQLGEQCARVPGTMRFRVVPDGENCTAMTRKCSRLCRFKSGFVPWAGLSLRHAARLYSLIRPPRTCLHSMVEPVCGHVTGVGGCGGCWSRDWCGRWVL